MPQMGWHVNVKNCIACRACEAACKQEFNLPKGVRRRLVVIQEGNGTPDTEYPEGKPFRRHISMACLHCANPACMTACPVERYWKDDDSNGALRTAFGMAGNAPTGLVLIKPNKLEDPVNGVDCVGCRRCLEACPYGAPQWNQMTRTMDKCTGCYHRLFNPNLPIESRKPACVVTCTSFALDFGDMATITALPGVSTNIGVEGAASEIADPTVTTPSVRFTRQIIT